MQYFVSNRKQLRWWPRGENS